MILGHHVIILLRVICKNLQRKSAKKSNQFFLKSRYRMEPGALMVPSCSGYAAIQGTLLLSTRVGYTDYFVSYDNNLLLSSIKSLYTLYDKLSPLKTAIRITDTTNGEVHV